MDALTYQGKSCIRCGSTKRYSITRRCVDCQRSRNQLSQAIHTKFEHSEKRKLYRQAYYKKYGQTERGKAGRRVANRNHKAKRRDAEGSYTTQEWLNLKAQYGFYCLRCGRHESELDDPLEQDHVIPISKGGTNWITNIQPLCETCNGPSGKWTKCTDYRLGTQFQKTSK